MNREEWLKARRSCITGTDIAAICGVHRYKGRIRVWQEKLGLVEEPELGDNEAVKWGQLLERVIADEWAKRNGKAIAPGTFKVRGIVGGTPDFIVDDGCGLEVKTAGFYSKDRWGHGDDQTVPDEYYLQCQWYMMLHRAPHWHLAVLLAGQDYRQYTIKRNDALIDKLRRIASDFWEQYVVTEEMPPADHTEDTTKALQKAFPRDEEAIAIATHDAEELAIELHHIKEQQKRLDERETEIENQLKQAIGDKEGIIGKEFKATWKLSKPRVMFDHKKLIKDLALPRETVQKYEYMSKNSRRFTFKYLGD